MVLAGWAEVDNSSPAAVANEQERASLPIRT
jgi:hypothetical protein